MSELRFEEWSMPGAEVGQENPLPALSRPGKPAKIDPERYPGYPQEILDNMAYGRVSGHLPYTAQDRYTRQRQERAFRVAVLENEILRASFLLELGGRLRSLVHKPSGRELLEANPVFQPANLAIRNAWFSGGVEWNIGMLGHFPLTCSPVFAGRVEAPDGTPVLRLWEWERIRQVPYQIDAYLPDGSPMLLVRVRISNPHRNEVPIYWWSNTAVPETEATRVLVPADAAYSSGYGETGPARVALPELAGTDITYTTRPDKAADFFFDVPETERHWISALDGEGRGLVQTSTDRLRGRKLFMWGNSPGGRKWQEFLSVPGRAYLEIQSGLTRTQGEHIPMPAGAVWEWLEGYGLMAADPRVVHGEDWPRARELVTERLEILWPREAMDAEFARSAGFADRPPVEVAHRGSGWGALERRRRDAAGEPPLCGESLVFDDASLGPQQAPWVELLEHGALGAGDPTAEPLGYQVQPAWRDLLEQAVAAGRGAHWLAWLHLGVLRHAAGAYAAAEQAWERSLEECETPWARRNLAVLAREEERTEEAAALYLEACRARPDHIPLAIECAQFLLAADRAQTWLELLPALSGSVRDQGRIRLLEGSAALATGDLERVERLLETPLVIDDLREGERSQSHLWFEYHEKRLSASEGVPVDEALKDRVRREFPVPRDLDYRMSVD